MVRKRARESSGMDEVDLGILEVLAEDSRTPFLEVARRLGISESAVRKRVRALVERGAIRRFTVEVDPAKLGFGAVAVVGIDADPSKLLEVARRVCELEGVRSVAITSGDHSIVAEVWARDTRELTRLLSEGVGSIEGVKRVCPAIVLERLKG